MCSFIWNWSFIRFVFVGALGFCIDCGVLILLMNENWEILPARSLSFLSAVTGTWFLNRFWTFKLEKGVGRSKEYAYYIVTQIIGAAINLLVFYLLIKFYPLTVNTPQIPLALGAAVSLGFNYTVSKKFVFKGTGL
jgi:putative flippase GtrA